ncbi:glycoside hydrolase family 43 protein [Asticcacaulis sp. AC466]|uniref:glycoside hydrolase family 43 protein n=1 Tax=Asticcacaulis sp. AC466 TaxID=1282362 RepID=UPI000689D937|nr:glycoside hydrolase family 43 protein [Asticcacaulis sp. AC466]
MIRIAAISAIAFAYAVPHGAGAGDASIAYFRYVGRSQERISLAPGQYRNPIVSGYAPDPSIVRVGADYYLVNSSFTNFPGLPIYHSRDLVTWRHIGNAIDRAGQFDFAGQYVSGGIMAPDISYHDGTFYIVSTNNRNFVITAKAPQGPWSDPVWLDFAGIDPSLFWDDDGKTYVVNNGPPDGPAKFPGHRVLWLQAFDPVAKAVTGPRIPLVGGGDNPPHLFWPEGPHLFKKAGWYYLIAAEGGTGPDEHHSEIVFRGRKIDGPYEAFSGNPILTQADLPATRPHPVEAAGHAKFVTTPSGDWWAVFLAARAYAPGVYNIGRETYLLPVKWSDDGWPTLLDHGTAVPFAVDKPASTEATEPGAPQNSDFSYIDTFDETHLGLGWMGVRVPAKTFFRLDHGRLVMAPGHPVGDTSATPAFIARKQAHAIAEVSTALADYEPDHDGDRAGLVALQSDDAYLFLGVIKVQGVRRVAVMRRETAGDPQSGRMVSSAVLPRCARTIRLRLKIDGGALSASYAWGEQGWKPLSPGGDATFLSTKKAGGFVGTIIGLENEANPSNRPAPSALPKP